MIESLWILILVGMTCSLVGNLLIQKQSVMVADAISHTILLGIVLAYFIVQDLDSPLLIIGATIFGVITVISIEAVVKYTNIRQDAAIGLIFTAFFSLAVILISKFFSNVHLDIDMVLTGDIIFAPLNRYNIGGISLPKAFVQNGIVFCIIVSFILFFYQSLKIRLFDETYARSIGMRVNLFDLILMTLVALTSVVAFQAVGAVLVIAMMVAPGLSAQLFAKSFSQLFIIGIIFAFTNALIGYYGAIYFNVSMSGMVAFANLITFLIAFVIKRIIH